MDSCFSVQFKSLRHISFFSIISLLFLFFPWIIPSSESSPQDVYIIQLNDATINPVTAEYISGAIDQAMQQDAQCLIIELDTPGGLLTSTRSIVKKMMASSIPVVVYIYPGGARAGSAGVFITYASHIAAMAPSTNIGAAHPVQMGGGKSQRNMWDSLRDVIDSLKQQKKGSVAEKISSRDGKKQIFDSDAMSSKILQDTVAFIRAIAKERNRNLQWAEEAVTKSSSVTETEALEKQIVDLIAKDEADLIQQLDGRSLKIEDRTVVLKTKNAVVRNIEMNFRQKILNVLVNPNIAYFFLIFGFYGLLYEVTHPGIGVPGVLGLIFLILAFFSLQTLPTNYAGLALIVLGVVLFIAEAMVPGFGLLTLGGLVCMILGSLLLFDSREPFMRVSLSMIIPVSVATAGITVFLIKLVVSSHRRKVLSGKEGLVGEEGFANTNIDVQEGGKVFVHGEIWNATCDEEINEGDEIIVVEVNGMKLKVKRKELV